MISVGYLSLPLPLPVGGFSKWIVGQVEHGRIKFGEYIINKEKATGSGSGRPLEEYHITIDAARRVARMSSAFNGAAVYNFLTEYAKNSPPPQTEPEKCGNGDQHHAYAQADEPLDACTNTWLDDDVDEDNFFDYIDSYDGPQEGYFKSEMIQPPRNIKGVIAIGVCIINGKQVWTASARDLHAFFCNFSISYGSNHNRGLPLLHNLKRQNFSKGEKN